MQTSTAWILCPHSTGCMVQVSTLASSLYTTGAISDTVSGASACSIIPAISISPIPSPSPGRGRCKRAGDIGPAVGGHELRPTLVEASWVEFTEAGIARPGSQVVVEALVPHAHLVVERIAPCHDALAGACTLLPILHVVLLK